MTQKSNGPSTENKGIYPAYPADIISDVRDLFIKSTDKYPDKIALQYKRADCWNPITYLQLRNEVEQAACGLASLGLKPRNGTLAIVGDNRPEWAVGYLAAACTAIVCVPIDKDLKELEVYNILRVSGARILIGDDKHMPIILDLRKKLPELAHICNMDAVHSKDDILSFSDLKRLGRDRMAAGINDFLESTVSAGDRLSILFTSGTTGNSKGAILTHGNVACNIMDAVKWVDLRAEDRFLSVLPMHHSYECTDGFLLALYRGATISYAENLRRIAENLAETRSTAMLGVPLLWHAFYRKIELTMAAKGLWKVNAAKKAAAFTEKYFRWNIRRFLFAKLHEKFGGCLRILISGGAAVDPVVARGFRELGIEFLQGYGLTESAPILAVNRNKAFRDAAAGLPLPSVEIRIADDGEILARGPNIMEGYYNNPEATKETLQDGWLCTGDLGYIDSDGFLYIRGRKKSVIVSPSGKNIYPEEVEAEILRSPYISECLVYGCGADDSGQDFAIEAIVVPDMEYFSDLEVGRGGRPDREHIEQVLQKEVKERCGNLAAYKKVRKIKVRLEEMEKTTTKKVKRYLYTS
ncbi:MAG: AMP-binding protein [Acidobacteria bacterium]|nr:AMP-binding protein [Acidobacteriota bacterium]